MHISLYDPRMSLDVALDALKAIAEETRLRIVALLAHGELTVTDLTEILGQSQPRVSRHLRLLVDAGLVTRHREGTWVFFRLVEDDRRLELVGTAIASVGADDAVLEADLARLDNVRARRSAAASEYFERIASIWDEERSLHAAADTVEAAILAAVGDQRWGRMLDVGTGTGRMLQLFADRAQAGVEAKQEAPEPHHRGERPHRDVLAGRAQHRHRRCPGALIDANRTFCAMVCQEL